MDPWKLTSDEHPPVTGSEVPVWIETAEGHIVPGSYAMSLCDAGADATGYWYDVRGNVMPPPMRWMHRKDGLTG
jgi:hypothetical protein